jgi:tripartite-type tricarboxylate transporter receptor subunit TctC
MGRNTGHRSPRPSRVRVGHIQRCKRQYLLRGKLGHGPQRSHSANILAAVAIVLTNGLSAADPIECSYKGQSITLTIGSEPGGGYDQYARTLARHIGRFIPGNPNVIPKNVPGADGIQAAHRLYKLAPRDGTEIGSFHRGIPLLPLIGQMKQIEFDATKLGWIGSLNKEASLCVSWHTSRIRTFEDMLEREFIVGVTAAGASLDTFEAPLMNLFGAKLKVVAGYRGGQNIDLAMERGEIDGRCGVSWSSLVVRAADWFKERKINILLQFGLNRHPDLKDVRMMQDIATKAEDKQALELLQIPTLIGRPFLAPPGVPTARLAALRSAFNAMIKDDAFRTDAAKQRMEIELVTGEEIQMVIARAYGAEAQVLARARDLMKIAGKP